MKAKQRQTVASGRATILVVEDEPDLQDVLQHNLSRNGYTAIIASSGEEAIKLAHRDRPHLILLDLMLPGMDGLDVCRMCKSDPETSAIPIVFLTAKGEESDVVAGLELGADDYIIKPFSPRVLLARLKVVLRRGAPDEERREETIVRVGELIVDRDRYEARANGTQVELTRTEFQILYHMARRPGRVFTRGQIVRLVQGDQVVVTDRSVDVHIVSLRRKLGPFGRYLQTVRGVGYRLEHE